jgi:hypothetical protein
LSGTGYWNSGIFILKWRCYNIFYGYSSFIMEV